jgi:carbonic anhydrase
MGNIQHFIQGFKLFQQQLYGDNERLAAKLAKGQSPKVLVISCSDSRVDPALLMGCSPGDIFTVRNIANLVPPYEPDNAYHGVSAALEYAVCFLKVEDIIVLGHSGCGGIEGLLIGGEGDMVGEFVGRWVDIAANARERALARVAAGDADDLTCICEQEAILTSLTNLQTFPWLQKRVLKGDLSLHGWYFVIERGELSVYKPDLGRFEVLVAEHNS